MVRATRMHGNERESNMEQAFHKAIRAITGNHTERLDKKP